MFFAHAHKTIFPTYSNFVPRSLLFSFAFLFIASFVAQFIVFRSHDVLAAFLSNKERNLICKG